MRFFYPVFLSEVITCTSKFVFATILELTAHSAYSPNTCTNVFVKLKQNKNLFLVGLRSSS
jgi:hypothetical protein